MIFHQNHLFSCTSEVCGLGSFFSHQGDAVQLSLKYRRVVKACISAIQKIVHTCCPVIIYNQLRAAAPCSSSPLPGRQARGGAGVMEKQMSSEDAESWMFKTGSRTGKAQDINLWTDFSPHPRFVILEASVHCSYCSYQCKRLLKWTV